TVSKQDDAHYRVFACEREGRCSFQMHRSSATIMAPSTPTIGPSPAAPGPDPANGHAHLAQRLWRDPVLLGAFLVTGLLVAFQLSVALLHPTPWSGPATDWLRTALAWPELLIVVGVSLYLSRAHRPATWSWWMWSVALLSYAIARTLWTIYDQLIYHNG